ncbi:hypothetical protein PoMZ_02750 [Pyricularia oryzae]|uniref:Uncharacterized protein n=1 Tax=Pyricularia oryzae TaxID=318829 RepID=A0A4V1C5W6_PYROR|nr:hypothetical protein PoMZ_02750 [Pyricularia oryzae]
MASINIDHLDMRRLLDEQKISLKEVERELVERWPLLGVAPSISSALVVLRHLLAVTMPSDHALDKVGEWEAKNPLLKMAWCRVKGSNEEERAEMARQLKSLQSGDGFIDVMESDLMHETFWSRDQYSPIADVWQIHEGNVVSTQRSTAEIGAAGLIRCGPDQLEDLGEHIHETICGESSEEDVEAWRQPIGRIPSILRVLYTPDEGSEPFNMSLVNDISPTFIGWDPVGKTLVSSGAVRFGLAAVVKLRDPNVPDSTDALRLYFPTGKPVHPYIRPKDFVGKKHDIVEVGWSMGTPPNEYMLYFTERHESRTDVFGEEVKTTQATVDTEELGYQLYQLYLLNKNGPATAPAPEDPTSTPDIGRKRIMPGGNTDGQGPDMTKSLRGNPGSSSSGPAGLSQKPGRGSGSLSNRRYGGPLDSSNPNHMPLGRARDHNPYSMDNIGREHGDESASSQDQAVQHGVDTGTSSAPLVGTQPPLGPRSWVAAGGQGNGGPQRGNQHGQQQPQNRQRPSRSGRKSKRPKVGQDQGPAGPSN